MAHVLADGLSVAVQHGGTGDVCAGQHAGCSSRGLRPHGTGEGSLRTRGDLVARPAQRADSGDYAVCRLSAGDVGWKRVDRGVVLDTGNGTPLVVVDRTEGLSHADGARVYRCDRGAGE